MCPLYVILSPVVPALNYLSAASPVTGPASIDQR
jgi:hypothetical protein